MNYRPEYEHAWHRKTYYQQLRLDPLPAASADELLERAARATTPSSQPLKRLLIERTEGNPFFLEESVRALVETGALVGERGGYRLARPLPEHAGAGHGAGGAGRAHRPPGARGQAPAPGGRGHRQGRAAAAAAGHRRAAGAGGCAQGWPACRPPSSSTRPSLFPDLEYTFKHALTHEVAYQGLLQERRRALHARIVEAIEQLYARARWPSRSSGWPTTPCAGRCGRRRSPISARPGCGPWRGRPIARP